MVQAICEYAGRFVPLNDEVWRILPNETQALHGSESHERIMIASQAMCENVKEGEVCPFNSRCTRKVRWLGPQYVGDDNKIVLTVSREGYPEK